MALITALKGQWDVNTRGRTDNSFREWVNGVTETRSGTTSVDTSNAYDGINFNGSTGYCRASVPAGLSATFADSDYTMAVRCKLDTTNPSWQSVFGAYASASAVTRIEFVTEDANGDGLGSHVPPSGDAVYLDGATQIDDAAEHVLVQRRVGNVFSLWIDGTKINEQTVAAGTVGSLNRISFGVLDQSSQSWFFDGTVKWAAIWDDDLSDADIGLLDNVENPFLLLMDVSSPYPGQLVTFTHNFVGAPLTANCSYNGVQLTLEAGATATTSTAYWPAESAFLYGGAHAATRWLTNNTLIIGNATESATLTTVQTGPASSDQIAARSAAALVNPIDSYNGGLTVATNDDVYQYSDPVDAFTPFPATNDFTPLEPAFTLYTKFYDVSASSWSGLTTLAFPVSAPVVDGTLEITSTTIAQAPPSVLVAGEYNLTDYGDLDWLKTARTAHSTFDTKSGGTIIDTPSDIGTPAWTRHTGGDASTNALISWDDGNAEDLQDYAGDRYIEYTSATGAGKRFIISPAGDPVKIYFWCSGYDSTGRVYVSFSDASASPATSDFTTGSGVVGARLVEITAHPTDVGATIQIDFTLISGSNVAWAAIAVQSASVDSLFSLTSSDTTVMPGDTITATLVGGPFAGAITAAYAVYGVHEIPLAWTVLTPSATSLTMPSLSSFAAGQSAEYLPWYANYTLRIVAGAESADSANTNQLIAPSDDDSYYGYLAARVLPDELEYYHARASSATDTDPDGVLSEVRANLLFNTGFSGAASGTPGTAPTGYTREHSAGTTVVTAIDLGNSIQYTVSAARHYDRLSIAVSANTTYVWSSKLVAMSGTITPQDILVATGLPAGAAATYRYGGSVIAASATIGSAGSVLEYILVVSSTAGTVNARIGISTSSGSYTGSITHAYPQFEKASARTDYMYNTSTTAARYMPAYDGYDGVILEGARTQLLYNTGFAGGVSGSPGTTPTAWTRVGVGSGGTRTFTTIDLGMSCRFVTANDTDREYIQISLTGTALAVYTFSAVVTIAAEVQIQHVMAPNSAFTTTVWRANGVVRAGSYTLPVGEYTIEVIATVDAVGGNIDWRMGAGVLTAAGRPVTGIDVTIKYPQVELGAFRSSYIYNTSTVASLARAASYIGAVPLANLGIASQTNEYTFAALIKQPFIHTSKPSFTTIASFGATSADCVYAEYSSTDGRINTNKQIASVTTGSVAITGLTWAVGDTILYAVSISATAGMIVRCNAVVASTPSATNNLGVAATTLYLNNFQGAGGSSFGNFQAFRLWDTALTQSQLEALTADDLIPVGDYATVIAPPWGYPPSGAQEGDKAYIEIVTGAGLPVAESFDFTETEDSEIHVYNFSAATQSWSILRTVMIPYTAAEAIIMSIVRGIVKAIVKVIT